MSPQRTQLVSLFILVLIVGSSCVTQTQERSVTLSKNPDGDASKESETDPNFMTCGGVDSVNESGDKDSQSEKVIRGFVFVHERVAEDLEFDVCEKAKLEGTHGKKSLNVKQNDILHRYISSLKKNRAILEASVDDIKRGNEVSNIRYCVDIRCLVGKDGFEDFIGKQERTAKAAEGHAGTLLYGSSMTRLKNVDGEIDISELAASGIFKDIGQKLVEEGY